MKEGEPVLTRDDWPKSGQLAYQENLKTLADLARNRKSHLYRFILRRVHDAVEAEELMQQAFAEAMIGLPGFRADSQLSTWLYGIATKLISNHLSRSPTRNFDWESDDVLVSNSSYCTHPDIDFDLRQLLERVEEHVAGLPREMQETFALVVVEDLPYAEVAERLDIPIGTVRSRMFRIRSILWSRLTKEGIGREQILSYVARVPSNKEK
jgi:RNA polymerase sigma factor (sigma-70 family)